MPEYIHIDHDVRYEDAYNAMYRFFKLWDESHPSRLDNVSVSDWDINNQPYYDALGAYAADPSAYDVI